MFSAGGAAKRSRSMQGNPNKSRKRESVVRSGLTYEMLNDIGQKETILPCMQLPIRDTAREKLTEMSSPAEGLFSWMATYPLRQRRAWRSFL